MLCSTVRQILVNTEEKYGPEDAIRYKISKMKSDPKPIPSCGKTAKAFPEFSRTWESRENTLR